MSQSSSPTLKTTGSSSNISAMVSSTPIRIGSGAGSFHGTHSTEPRPASVATETFDTPGSAGPQSSSVPSAHTLAALASSTAATTGSSNPSLITGSGMSAVLSSSLTPPNSAGLRQSSGGGLANWASDNRDKNDTNQADKASNADASKLNRKESYKAQRKNYRREKKRVATELLNSLQDPAVIVLADWLKVRGTLKSWTKLWCVLKPGHLLIYKSPKIKSSHWVGTILLTSCQVIERPSKKDGFCFKLFHPLEQSIWAPRGPDRETIGAVVQPLPTTHLIFRAPSQAAGKCWMDALELSLRCSALLLRSNSSMGAVQSSSVTDGAQISHETQWSEADYEKHFNEHVSEKRYARYLTLPDIDINRSPGHSDASQGPTRSQTPLLQQFYDTMTYLERKVPHAYDFHKIKGLSKFVKSKHKDMCDQMDMSDISSAENSPKRSTLFLKSNFKSVRLPANLGERQMQKAVSLDTHLHGNDSSSSDEEPTTASMAVLSNIKKLHKSTRPVSAPPFVVDIQDLDADSQNEGATAVMSGPETDSDSDGGEPAADVEEEIETVETPYVPVRDEVFGETGEQVEVLAEENKSLIWCLLKQVRPGMDLSKVVLPTFILEPRSFLDKLSDSYFHADILSRAVTEDDPFTRMKTVVQWYLSGFYKKPKGLKKPYNPILGETFRCYWEHPNGSRTFYIAEQVSHHPPVSAFYVTNRQDGFCINCSILAKSKFYGNSTSAVLEGIATLTLLPRGESYTLNTPYAHCKGILVGTLSMELGGKINIDCENTGYKTELEFKLKPLLGGSDIINAVSGKIKLGKETLAHINGHWDTEMRIKDAKTGDETVLFAATPDTKQKRLTRYVVPLDAQLPTESERLWQHVSRAIHNEDQIAATQEKTILEEAQRNTAKERRATMMEWEPNHFHLDPVTGQWIYKYADLRPWDPRNDMRQFEADYKVLTKTKHKAPMVRTSSIVSSDALRKTKNKIARASRRTAGSALTDSSQSPEEDYGKRLMSNKSMQKLMNTLDSVNKSLEEHTKQLVAIQSKLERMNYAPGTMRQIPSFSFGVPRDTGIMSRSLPQSVVVKSTLYFFAGILLLCFIKWLLK